MRDFVADTTFEGQDYREKRLPKGDYENCTFINCKFQNGYLDNYHFVDCEFVDCDLTNANVAHSQFNVVVFKKCKLVGVHFENCDPLFLSLRFYECNLELASFYELELPNTLFDSCVLQQTDFVGAVLTQAKFPNCNLEGAQFEGTALQKADFTTALNFTIDPTKNQLQKARFQSHGLIGLLKKYDIVVE